MTTENDEGRPRNRYYDNGQENDGQRIKRPYQSYNRSNYGNPSGNYDRQESNYNRPTGNYDRQEGNYNRPTGNYDRQEGNYNRPGGNYDRQEGNYNRPNGNYDRQRPTFNRQGNDYNRGANNYDRRDNGYAPRNRQYDNYQQRPYENQYPYENRQQESNENDAPIKKRRPRVGEVPTPVRNNYNFNRQQQGNYNRNSGGYQQRPQMNRSNQSSQPYRRQPDKAAPFANGKVINKKQLKYREENFDPSEELRLNKYLSNAGICSRREADEFIKAGLVKVNGESVTELGTKVKRSDEITFHNESVKLEHKVYVLLNKPKNCVTTADDPQERLTVMDLVKTACHERIFPVGRLDRNTTGVLLLTNDGDLASKLTHPKFLKKKIYHVWLDKSVSVEDMQKIADGVELEDGEIHADAISYVTETDKDQVGIEIHSGRNRVVRRMFEALGYHVMRLDRVYFAGLTKKNLKRGQWRYLNEKEVTLLRMGAFD
jgi:23S rRNA pseudouridine2605 synthase